MKAHIINTCLYSFVILPLAVTFPPSSAHADPVAIGCNDVLATATNSAVACDFSTDDGTDRASATGIRTMYRIRMYRGRVYHHSGLAGSMPRPRDRSGPAAPVRTVT